MKNSKKKVVTSFLALLLCLSMLVGTTFAWFTDSVVTGINTIAAGTLDVELYHSNAATQEEKVKSDTMLFLDLQGEPILWEPGVVSYENLRVANEGDLALAYQLAIATEGENFVVEPDTGKQYGLSQILKVGVVEGGITATDRAGVVASVEEGNWTTLSEFVRNGSLLAKAEDESEETWGLVVYWEPGDYDNCWNLNNGKTLNEGDVLQIELGINLVATQKENEFDSFDNGYDSNAAAEFFPGFQGGTAGAAVTTDDQGLTTSEVAMDGGDVAAVVPAGVQVADGANSMALSVTMKSASEANIQLGESEEMRPLDVHIEGVAAGNTTPMLITLKHYLSTGINTGALRLYHVENGATVPMTQVAAPANHNEFSYDPATGDLTLALASFSEIATVADNNNTWNGTAATAWSGSGTEAAPYLITNADELAYFRNLVDGGRTFAGEYVKLTQNITLSNVNFDPIGWGYENSAWNRNGAPGKVFKGTFDGNGKTIFGLYQNGWELEETTGTDYTYTNCGFGLFAAASGATFKNLTISGADIQTECVEMGVLVGLSQGSCTYENINIYNSKIANYQRPTGGLIGEVSPLNGGGETKITNVVIGSDVVVGTLWGDFDAPVGGVIGARWDDSNTTKVNMKNVEVSCQLDVYNDITSAYQWHAYRRAGMLIGNTETYAPNEKGVNIATADFLTCENVKAYLGSWSNYTYCEFSNEQNPGRNYPWVRVQAGENNPAYSNPRYGHPADINGNPVTGTHDETIHLTGDGHELVRNFGQLYGGGQGIYGATMHTGAELINLRYTITYMNGDEVLEIAYITQDGEISTQNNDAQALVEQWATGEFGEKNFVFGGWMTAGSKAMEKIPADNTKNVVLYPFFDKPYTASFVDLQGNVLAQCYFYGTNKLGDLDATKDEAQSLLPEADVDTSLSHWEVHYNGKSEEFNKDKFKSYGQSVTVYPVYTYNGKLNLMPHDDDGDGMTDYYTVEAASGLKGDVVVPGKVNGIPVTSITDLSSDWLNTQVTSIVIKEGVQEISAKAFAMTSGLSEVTIPVSVTKIGKNAFASDGFITGGIGSIIKTITITYNGTKDQWNQIEKANGWDNNVKRITVVCTDGTLTY